MSLVCGCLQRTAPISFEIDPLRGFSLQDLGVGGGRSVGEIYFLGCSMRVSA